MEAGIYDKWGKKIGHSYGPPKSEPPVRSSELGRPSPLAPGSAFEAWITEQDKSVDWDIVTPTEAMRMAWNAAAKAAAKQCKEYAHSGANVYRRQVAYACQRRIEALVETPNEKLRHGANNQNV